MKKTIFLFTSLLLSLLLYAGDFDITQYGAVGDGIKKAIDLSAEVKPEVALIN